MSSGMCSVSSARSVTHCGAAGSFIIHVTVEVTVGPPNRIISCRSAVIQRHQQRSDVLSDLGLLTSMDRTKSAPVLPCRMIIHCVYFLNLWGRVRLDPHGTPAAIGPIVPALDDDNVCVWSS
jgi:hypothetical protein